MGLPCSIETLCEFKMELQSDFWNILWVLKPRYFLVQVGIKPGWLNSDIVLVLGFEPWDLDARSLPTLPQSREKNTGLRP